MKPLEIFRDIYFKDAKVTKQRIGSLHRPAGLNEIQFFYIDGSDKPSFAYYNYKPKIKPSQEELIRGRLQREDFFADFDIGSFLVFEKGFLDNVKASYKDGDIILEGTEFARRVDTKVEDYIKEVLDKTEVKDYNFTKKDDDFALVLHYLLDSPIQKRKLGNATLIGTPELSACKYGYMFLIFD